VAISRGQYSDAVLNELESQNDQQVEGILGKVKVLKDVSGPFAWYRDGRGGAQKVADGSACR
jgi:hypothetical protein